MIARKMTGLALAFLLLAAAKPAPPPPKGEEVCVLKTSLGTMVLRFFDHDAPKTSANFKRLVRKGFYDGKTFYRVVSGHVIQAGDGGESGEPKVPAEVNAHLHVEGAVGLARGADPGSGSTEFYICLAPRPHLDGKYTVFGQLVEGTDVLEKIGAVEVEQHFEDGVAFHRPKTPVVIEKATIERRVLATP
jgi:cyclophilin family peptidyl-prolyl cis-trans isomerase